MKNKQIWFTSDHHFGHKNIIKYSNRPFKDVDEMDQEMIKRWNEKVNEADDVYHLGDFALNSPAKLRQIRNQLNGKIYLIAGNHESTALACAECFEWIKDYFELIVEDQDAHHGQRFIALFHYALRVWNASHHGTWHLYGHSHGDLPDDNQSLSFDVGVDSHNFYPINYEEVKKIMSLKNWVSPIEPRNK